MDTSNFDRLNAQLQRIIENLKCDENPSQDDDDFFIDEPSCYSDDCWDYEDYRSSKWDAMTDGMYGDMPDDFDGDYDSLGF